MSATLLRDLPLAHEPVTAAREPSAHVHDALVIGGGPAGAASAILLAQAGWDVALVEKAAFPRAKVCGECLSPAAWPVLEALGVRADVEAAAGMPIQELGLSATGGEWLLPFPAIRCGTRNSRVPVWERTRDTRVSVWERIRDTRVPTWGRARDAQVPAWGRALAREHLDALLLARARAVGVRVHQPALATDIVQTENGVRCSMRPVGGTTQAAQTGPGAHDTQGTHGTPADSPHTPAGMDTRMHAHADAQQNAQKIPAALHATLLIDARGTPANPLDTPARPKRPQDLLAFKTHLDAAACPDGRLWVLAFPGGYGGLVRAGGATGPVATLAFCLRRDRLAHCRARWPALPAGAAAAQFVADQCPVVRTALQAGGAADWLGTGVLVTGMHPPPWHFAVGNAAGEAHPLIGEGMNMALQSAWLLAHRLAPQRTRIGEPEMQMRLRAACQADWQRAFGRRMAVAAALAHLAMHPATARAFARACARWPALLAAAVRAGGKLQAALPD